MLSKAISTSKKFAAAGRTPMGEFAQLLYTLLVAHSDDFGRQEGDPFTVKHKVMPTSCRPEADFASALDILKAERLIEWYAADSNEQVIQIVDFDAHQSGLHKRSNSVFPEPPGISGNFREIPSELNRTELNRTERNTKAPALVVSALEFQRLRDRNAYVSDRLLVPNALHREFASAYGEGAEAALQSWYVTVRDGLGEAESIDDVFAWLRPRFRAWMATTGRVKAPPTAPRVNGAPRSSTAAYRAAMAAKGEVIS